MVRCRGVRVVVTRARAQAGALVSALAEAGAAVIELPVIALADPPDGGAALRTEAARADTYDWIVLTSSNAVDRFVGLLRDGRALGRARLAAVGVATARALARHRLVADLVADVETAEGLVRAMPESPSGAGRSRVLFPRAVGARAVVAPGLRDKGWEVTEVDAYRTVAAGRADGIGETELDLASSADVITFTSPSTVTSYVELAGRRRTPPVVACIGPVTAAAARDAGFHVDVVADEHSVDGLVAALSAHLGAVVSPPT